MTDLDQIYADFGALSQELLERVDGVTALWYLPESEHVVDIRIALAEDTWEMREGAIEAMTGMRIDHLDDVSINYSFTLPDAAYEQRSVAGADQRIRALV